MGKVTYFPWVPDPVYDVGPIDRAIDRLEDHLKLAIQAVEGDTTDDFVYTDRLYRVAEDLNVYLRRGIKP